jgi:hypothetical protein
LHRIIHISQGDKSYVCRIIGVLTPRTNNKPWDTTPNLKVFLPYTYFMTASSDFWGGAIQHVLIEIEEGSGLEKTGVVVGFLSGLAPALKAERLEIAEALRAE